MHIGVEISIPLSPDSDSFLPPLKLNSVSPFLLFRPTSQADMFHDIAVNLNNKQQASARLAQLVRASY